VHYPSDILAGFLLGSGWALLVSAVFSYLRGRGTLPAAEVPYD
jgi:membrane-associated phospholipid phosphatase